MQIITDEAQLRLPCEPVSLKEGGQIARLLTSTLERHNKKKRNQARKVGGMSSVQIGVGLSAPQIGIQKQVCCLFINEVPTILMNPVVVAHSEIQVPIQEGCLSFPGKNVDTLRWAWVTVDTLNVGRKTFGPTNPDQWGQAYHLLKSVVCQHEVAHVFGLLFTDFAKACPEPEEWTKWSSSIRSGVLS
jgi:peptide deformylase